MEISSNSYNITNLPQEILGTIFSYLSDAELLVVRPVSRIFEQTATDPVRWKKIAHKYNIDIPDSDVAKKVISEINKLNEIGLKSFPKKIKIGVDLFNQYENILYFLSTFDIENDQIIFLRQPEIVNLFFKAQISINDLSLRFIFSPTNWRSLPINIHLLINEKQSYTVKTLRRAIQLTCALNENHHTHKNCTQIIKRLLDLGIVPDDDCVRYAKIHKNQLPEELFNRIIELNKQKTKH